MAEDQKTLNVRMRLATSIQTAHVVNDRYLRHINYWTRPRSRGAEEDVAASWAACPLSTSSSPSS